VYAAAYVERLLLAFIAGRLGVPDAGRVPHTTHTPRSRRAFVDRLVPVAPELPY
jgi:hypothetical protein